ncbi:MAG TPA: MaoC family dehydratase [Rhizobiales bacterium]|nr:MaoC family dehydratase [Hyphomicrobiales bacterium]
MNSPAVVRRPWLDARPGDALPVLTRKVTQEMIDAYAEASGDFNPIHVDPEYSKTGPFGRTIAHGLMTLAFVAQVLNEWSGGRFDASGEIDIAFVGPVFAGDTIEVTGAVEGFVERDGIASVRVKLTCRAGERLILAGHALQPIDSGKS